MSTPDKAELQHIAQLVEVNRERLQNIESQVVRLEEVRQEQARAIMALETIPKDGASDAMIPLGGGVQIVAGSKPRRPAKRHLRYCFHEIRNYCA